MPFNGTTQDGEKAKFDVVDNEVVVRIYDPAGNTALDSINTKLDNISGLVDGLEGFTDGLEGSVDGLEALNTTLNSTASAIAASVDSLETYTDNIEPLLTALGNNTDTLETILNSGIATMLDKVSTVSLTALDSANTINTNGCSSFGIQITGTWVGQCAFEGTKDGVTWYAVAAYPHSGTGATVSTTTGNTQLVVSAGSNTQMRVRRSIATSGTAVVTVVGSIGTHLAQVYQLNANNLNGTVTVPNMQVCPTATQTTVTATTTSVALLAANVNRKKVIIVNESNKDIYITFGATATVTNYTHFMGAGPITLEITQPIYTGAMSCIATGAGSTLRVTELA